MVRPSAVHDPDAVRRAIREFIKEGRDEFLSSRGWSRSTDYFVQTTDGQLLDSKPILARAYYIQEELDDAEMPKGFSGGTKGVVKRLRQLGFSVVTRAQVHPPVLGEKHWTRTDIYDAYGGDRVPGIAPPFPGESTINVFSDETGPYDDEPPSLVNVFGYRGAGLEGPQSLSSAGNQRLEEARTSTAPVRFWYKPVGEPFTFLTWVIIIGRAWVNGVDTRGEERPEIEWILQPVPSPISEEWPRPVTDAVQEGLSASLNGPNSPESRPDATYSELLQRVDERSPRADGRRRVRIDPVRSSAARRAVLVRSEGICESPFCTNMPGELNRQGQPILDVDHIKDLALGGDDHPLNMVAICPNCHAVKTRGQRSDLWRRELLKAARVAHANTVTYSEGGKRGRRISS